MWTIGDGEPEQQQTQTRPDCPGCGEPDLHGDDFCHECGHSFSHFGNADDFIEGAEHGATCPSCRTGELTELDYGPTQCESCGYTLRDEG